MSTKPTAGIPTPVVHRLTQYMVLVERLRARGAEWTSSREIADELGLTGSTVRQDLSHLDLAGMCKRGYRTSALERALLRELGGDRATRAAVVGAGNLGRALILHGEFARRGFRLVALFDADGRLQGKRFGTVAVQPMEELTETVRELEIEIGMIAVPAAAAQNVADALAAAGVRGILNMTPAHVQTPATVPVVDARVVASLQELYHRMHA